MGTLSHRKTIHQNEEYMSDDSSDVSYTEVKLHSLYSKSNNLQNNLINVNKLEKFNEKLGGAILNLVKLDAVKE